MFHYWAIFFCNMTSTFSLTDSANIFPPSHCLLAVDGIFCCAKDWAFRVVKYSFNSFWVSCVGKVNLPQFLDCTCSLLLFQEFYYYFKFLNIKFIWSFFHMVCAVSSTLLSSWLKASCARFFFFFFKINGSFPLWFETVRFPYVIKLIYTAVYSVFTILSHWCIYPFFCQYYINLLRMTSSYILTLAWKFPFYTCLDSQAFIFPYGI